jgi:hypothetical protein
MSTEPTRQFHLPLAELIDRLCVDQIKEVLLAQGKDSQAREIKQLEHDIDLLLREKQVPCTARLLRVVIVLAQMNLHIWHHKDLMAADQERYLELLKLAHQLNGIRNRMKNLLLEETGDREPAARRSNTETDGLTGWDVSI